MHTRPSSRLSKTLHGNDTATWQLSDGKGGLREAHSGTTLTELTVVDQLRTAPARHSTFQDGFPELYQHAPALYRVVVTNQIDGCLVGFQRRPLHTFQSATTTRCHSYDCAKCAHCMASHGATCTRAKVLSNRSPRLAERVHGEKTRHSSATNAQKVTVIAPSDAHFCSLGPSGWPFALRIAYCVLCNQGT